jgi:tetratricopeptide (TPR) repeat protein
MSLLARILSLRGDVEEALTLQIEVCESRQTPGLESDRDRREGDLALSAALLDLADSLADLGDLEGAQRQQTKAVRLRRKFFKGKHPVTLEAESALARTLRERGQLDKSAKMLRRIVVLAERELGKTHDNTLRWIFELSQTLQKQGDTAEAARRIEETLTLLKRGGDLEQVARWTCRLADVKEAQGDWAAARELDVDALALNERLFGSEGRPTLETRLTVSQRNRRMGSLWESFQTQTELLETCRCAFGAESHVAVLTLISLAKTVQQLGDPTASHTMASEARAIAMRIVGPQHLIFRRLAKLEGQNAG